MTRKRPKPLTERTASTTPVGSQATEPTRTTPSSKRVIWIIIALLSTVALGSGLAIYRPNLAELTETQGFAAASFVGSESCAGCHQEQAKLWSASQHKAAMQHATEKTVLGNFDDASFDYYGVHSHFFRKDGKYLVETDGPDGQLALYEVRYTFGIEPLQQYLVEFPDGRLQALSIAWDSRPKDHGGQRWFHIHPNEEIKHDDVLHWTKLNQNWNYMCAECHSTGVRKNYDASTDRFATKWAEISVGCEACHGQGSSHKAWAHQRQSWWPFGRRDDPNKGLLVLFDERHGVTWPMNSETGIGTRSAQPSTLRKEVETCGLCHARRGSFHEDWLPGQWLSQTHVVEPLARTTYHTDGQIRDNEEPYNYTPFKEGKMFAAGVTCSDCHEPHSAKLRASGEGVCLQCHAPARFADAKHHHHGGIEPQPTCISCHMQTRNYMVVDPRHDHTFRVPRPDLSVTSGAPNACNDCHRDKSAEWAATAVDQWFGAGRKGFQSFGAAFHAARSEQADAAALLAAVASESTAPGVARATALSELASLVSPSNIAVARKALSDPDPMVRIGALDMLASLPATQIWAVASPLLADPVRGVRIRAASVLAAVPDARQPQEDRARFDRAAAEFVDAQRANAERPEARTTLANFFAQRGRTAEAEAEYRAALRLSSQYVVAAINLADLYRQLGRETEGEAVLREAVATSPRDAAVHHALGLNLTRQKRPELALAEFQTASQLEPDRAQYPYVYAVALHSAGKVEEAMSVLRRSLANHPNDRSILSALLAFSRTSGNMEAALDYAQRLALVSPDDPNLARIIDELRRAVLPAPREQR